VGSPRLRQLGFAAVGGAFGTSGTALGIASSALAATVVLAMAAAAARASPAPNERCEPQLAMLKVPGGDAYQQGGMSGMERTYVCSYATGHSVEVGEPGNPEASSEGGVGPAVMRLTFAGAMAGVVFTDEDGARELQVIDMADARVRFSYRLGGGSSGPSGYSEAGQQDVGAIVLKADGSVAWTEKGAGRGGYDVLAHDRRGTAVLDAQASTAARSLTLQGSTLRWRWYDGARHSALLD
jgi:hypothetical protein